MTLNDLKTGMIVTTRNGYEYTVIRDHCSTNITGCDVFVRCIDNTRGWLNVREYNPDLSFTDKWSDKQENRAWDIVKVEVCEHPFGFMDLNYNRDDRKVIWEEPPAKKLTVSEIEKLLGYKVEIVSEEEWRVVNRAAKAGDYVRITVNDYPFDDRDTVLKVNSVDENGHIDILISEHPKCKEYLDNHGGWFSSRWVYLKGEYEVVEKVENYRKITRLPKVGDYVKIIESKYSYDSPEYMLKICEVMGNDRMVFGVSVWGEDHPGVIKMREYDPVNAPTKCHWNHNFNTWEFYEKV